MSATRTFSSERARPLVEPFLEAIVSFRRSSKRSARVSTISWLVVRLRSRARRASLSFSSSGMRSRTSPFSLGRPAERPEPWKGTAKREARMPTATSFRLPPRASTSRARRRLSCAGMRTRTSVRFFAISSIDSTNVLSDAAKLLADEEDPLRHGQPGGGGQEGDGAREDELVQGGEHEARGDDDHALGAASEAHVPFEPE